MSNIKVIKFTDISLETAKNQKTASIKFFFWTQEEKYYSFGFKTELVLEKNYKQIKISIAKEFYSNGANIPFFLKKIFPSVGRNYDTACFYHDFLYTYGQVHGISRLESDEIFYQIMNKDNVGFFTRSFFFLAVRIFGGFFFGKISQAN